MDDDLYRLGLSANSLVRHDSEAGARVIAARRQLQRTFAEAEQVTAALASGAVAIARP